MRLSTRFKRLSLWNKLFVIGSLASIISLPLSFILFITGQKVSLTETSRPYPNISPQSASGVKPLTESERILRTALSLMVTKPELTPEDKVYISGLLRQVSVDDIERLINRTPEHSQRRSLESMLRSKQIVNEARLSGIDWNGGAVLVRFLRLTDATLDLENTAFYPSEDTYNEVTKKLDLSLPDGVSIQACDLHLSSRHILELLIIRQPAV